MHLHHNFDATPVDEDYRRFCRGARVHGPGRTVHHPNRNSIADRPARSCRLPAPDARKTTCVTYGRDGTVRPE